MHITDQTKNNQGDGGPTECCCVLFHTVVVVCVLTLPVGERREDVVSFICYCGCNDPETASSKITGAPSDPIPYDLRTGGTCESYGE